MANPFPFVASTVLTAAQLNGIGEATASWSPSYTNLTVGNGTVVAKFTRVNKLIYGYWKITLGSTSAITGAVRVSFPVSIATDNKEFIIGSTIFVDASTSTNYFGFLYNDTLADTMFGTVLNASATYATQQNVSATVPVAFATGDILKYSFLYEAA